MKGCSGFDVAAFARYGVEADDGAFWPDVAVMQAAAMRWGRSRRLLVESFQNVTADLVHTIVGGRGTIATDRPPTGWAV